MATTYELIASTTLSSAAVPITFSNIPSTFDDLELLASSRSSQSVPAIGIWIRFNGDTNAANYSWRRLTGNGTSAGSSTTGNAPMIVPGATATSNTFGSLSIYVPNYAGSTNKSISATGAQENNQTAAEIFATAGLWSNTAAITSVSFYVDSSANYATGSSFFLYGIKKA